MKDLFKQHILLIISLILPNTTLQQLEFGYKRIKEGLDPESFSDKYRLALKFYEIYLELC